MDVFAPIFSREGVFVQGIWDICWKEIDRCSYRATAKLACSNRKDTLIEIHKCTFQLWIFYPLVVQETLGI